MLPCVCVVCSWKTPGGVFQAYGSYWPEGYIAHLAWAATWMCRYDSSACSSAVQWFNTAMNTNSLRYGLGYDWDSTFPGVAALVISMNLTPLVDQARQYLEGYILTKWAVRDTEGPWPVEQQHHMCGDVRGTVSACRISLGIDVGLEQLTGAHHAVSSGALDFVCIKGTDLPFCLSCPVTSLHACVCPCLSTGYQQQVSQALLLHRVLYPQGPGLLQRLGHTA